MDVYFVAIVLDGVGGCCVTLLLEVLPLLEVLLLVAQALFCAPRFILSCLEVLNECDHGCSIWFGIGGLG